MKTKEIQELPIGTKLYYLDFDIEAKLGQIVCQIIVCEVRSNLYDSGRHVARPTTWRGVKSWRSVSPRWCYQNNYQAERELVFRLKMLRERLYTLETTTWATGSVFQEEAGEQ